jgi:hypothetical protein
MLLTHNADSAPPPMRTQKGISYQFSNYRIVWQEFSPFTQETVFLYAPID